MKAPIVFLLFALAVGLKAMSPDEDMTNDDKVIPEWEALQSLAPDIIDTNADDAETGRPFDEGADLGLNWS